MTRGEFVGSMCQLYLEWYTTGPGQGQLEGQIYLHVIVCEISFKKGLIFSTAFKKVCSVTLNT